MCHPLMPLLSCSEYYLNAPFTAQLPKQPKSKQSFHGVGGPTTYEEKGSDLYRAYLTRLCGVFRLSRPLDALFRLNPFPPCFMRVTSLGFRLQRVSPRGNRYVSSTYPVPSCRFLFSLESKKTRLQGCQHPRDPYVRGQCYPDTLTSILS